MVYNLTNVTEANDIYEWMFALNQQANGHIGTFILASLFLLIFMVFKKYEDDTKQVFLVDCTITSIVAILFWTIELIPWTIVIYPIIMLFASIVIYKFSE